MRRTVRPPRRASESTAWNTLRAIALPPVDGLTGRARGFVEVQNGCDHRCTFCVIPFGRGHSRSAPARHRGRADAPAGRRRGIGEVVLTGVDITAYGGDLPGRPSLGALVARVLTEAAGAQAAAAIIARLRRGRRRPLSRHRRGGAAHAALPSLPSVRRRHGPEAHEAAAFAPGRRAPFATGSGDLRPDVVFGADMIAGFPTETEAMFQTLAAISSTSAASPTCTSFPSLRGPARRPRACRRSRRRLVHERAGACAGRARRAFEQFLQERSGPDPPGPGREQRPRTHAAFRAGGVSTARPRPAPSSMPSITAAGPRHLHAPGLSWHRTWPHEFLQEIVHARRLPAGSATGGAPSTDRGGLRGPTGSVDAAAAEPRLRAPDEATLPEPAAAGAPPAPVAGAPEAGNVEVLEIPLLRASPTSSPSAGSMPRRWRNSRKC